MTRVGALLVFSFLSFQALAEPMIVIGKGIEDRKTGEVIVLTCQSPVEEGYCPRGQFALINPETFEVSYQKGAYLFSREKFEKEVKGVVSSGLKKPGNSVRGIFGMAAITLIGGGLAVAFNSFIPAAIGVLPWPICASRDCDPGIFDPVARASNAFKSPERASEATLNQDGWNWAEEPVKINHKTFKRLKEKFFSGVLPI